MRTLRLGRGWALALLVATFSVGASAASPAGGYWLSAQLDGGGGQRAQAATEMSGDAERVFPLDPAATLPGEAIARVARVQEAMLWVSRWAFDGHVVGVSDTPQRIREAAAPSPGAGLHKRHGVILRALVVTGATSSDGVREIGWPLDQESILPPDSEWIAAALVPKVAPLFGAPAPYVPPAAERSGQARRSGGLYLLGYLDRCSSSSDGEKAKRTCMRWAQVVARDGDHFTPGYLPAFQVATLEAWVRTPGNLPRAQLIASAIEGDKAFLHLLVRLKDNTLHGQTLELGAVDGGFPHVEFGINAEVALLKIDGELPLEVELSPDMDRRERSTSALPVLRD